MLRRMRLRHLALAAAATTAAALLVTMPDVHAQPVAGSPAAGQWEVAGQNLDNTRNAAGEHLISAQNAATLAPRWTATLNGAVAATPTVSNGTVFVPDWGGKLWAIDAATGKPQWSRYIGFYSGIPWDVSRTSPAVWGSEIVFGDGASISLEGNGAHVMAANRTTGAKLWNTVVDHDSEAMITTSPVIVGNTVYVGVASRVEFHGFAPPTTFRGSVVALDATTGAVKWKRYTAPLGYTGNAVWGSSFPVDQAAGTLFVSTGNNYTAPKGVCTDPDQQNCTAPPANDYTDSVLALDLRTGAVKWSFKTLTTDVGEIDCKTCGPDFDFGSAPNLFHATVDGHDTAIVGVGQKSGIYWALNEATGKPVWHTVVGPGGDLGGIEWGSATDGHRIYVAIGNSDHESYTVTAADGTQSTTTGGSWSALDPATGRILWQTADPNTAPDPGFVSTANGVVYGGDNKGGKADTMFALDAATGTILWRFDSGGAVIGGAAIVDGTVYWGSGYWMATCSSLTLCGWNTKLYAFSPAAARPTGS